MTSASGLLGIAQTAAVAIAVATAMLTHSPAVMPFGKARVNAEPNAVTPAVSALAIVGTFESTDKAQPFNGWAGRKESS